MGISLVLVFVLILFSGIHLHAIALIFPLVLIELYLLALALAFFLSALYVKYRDITYMWELLLQAAFYATPILYPMQLVLSKNVLLAKIMLLNPMAQIIQDSRYALVSRETITPTNLIHNSLVIALPVISVLLAVVAASYYFRKSSKYFAENV